MPKLDYNTQIWDLRLALSKAERREGEVTERCRVLLDDLEWMFGKIEQQWGMEALDEMRLAYHQRHHPQMDIGHAPH